MSSIALVDENARQGVVGRPSEASMGATLALPSPSRDGLSYNGCRLPLEMV